MAVSIVYDPQLSRVRVTATELGGADTALVERSVNQIAWTTVRGGQAALVFGGSVTVDDYEFTAGVPNFYRITTARDIVLVGAGTAAQADNAPVTPGLPAGHQEGDVLLLVAAIHNVSGGRPTPPAGYTLLRSFLNMQLFGKVAGPAETAPTVTFTGGQPGPTGAQIAALRNAQFEVESSWARFNPSSQNILYGPMAVHSPHSAVVYIGWKRANWTSVDTLPGDGGTAVEIGEFTSFVSGVGQGVVWDWLVQNTTAPVNVPVGEFTVNGGPADINHGGTVAIPPTTLVQTGQITPTIDTIWLKNPARPFLNRPVTVTDYTDLERAARNGVFPVVGRTLPVAVTDLMLSRQFTLTVRTPTVDAARELDLVVSAGDPLFLHTPPGCEIPTLYAVVGNTTLRRTRRAPNLGPRYTDLPLTEVAAPGPDVAGTTSTYQTVLNTYATYGDVIANEASYLDLMENIGSPNDIPVP